MSQNKTRTSQFLSPKTNSNERWKQINTFVTLNPNWTEQYNDFRNTCNFKFNLILRILWCFSCNLSFPHISTIHKTHFWDVQIFAWTIKAWTKLWIVLFWLSLCQKSGDCNNVHYSNLRNGIFSHIGR